MCIRQSKTTFKSGFSNRTNFRLMKHCKLFAHNCRELSEFAKFKAALLQSKHTFGVQKVFSQQIAIWFELDCNSSTLFRKCFVRLCLVSVVGQAARGWMANWRIEERNLWRFQFQPLWTHLNLYAFFRILSVKKIFLVLSSCALVKAESLEV